MERFGPGARIALIEQARSITSSLLDLQDVTPNNVWDVGTHVPVRPRYPANLSILLVSRKIYQEVYPVLLRVAVFSLATIEDHIRMTQPRFLPLFGRLRNLSVTSSVLTEWSPTLVRLLLPSISCFEIRDLRSTLFHEQMLGVDSLLPHEEQHFGGNPVTTAGALDFFKQLLLILTWKDRSSLAAVISHFLEAENLYKCLILHFGIGCHWGDMGPHDHPVKNFVLAFGEPDILIHNRPSVVTLRPEHLAETVFCLHAGFPTRQEAWVIAVPNPSSEAEDVMAD